MEHAARLESAFVAYLGALTWPDSLTTGGVLQLTSSRDESDTVGQYILAYVDGDMGAEDPQFSSNRWCDFVVTVHTPVERDADAIDAHDAVSAAIEDAILTIGIEDSLSGSTLHVYRLTDKAPVSDQSEEGWVTGYRFKVYSCAI